MKIGEIEAIPARVGRRNQLLVKITAEDGTVGWGESGLSSREHAVIGAIAHFREFLRGQDARKIGRIWQECYRSQYFEGGRVLTAAISAIDIALHDLKGKALGAPVYELLGGRQRELVPIFATTSASASGQEMIDQAKKLVDHGWQCIRFSPAHHEAKDIYEPRLSIAETAKWLIAAREELGGEPVFGIDYHHRLSVAEAASFCQKLPPANLDWLEEPIRDESPEAYASLRTMTEIPFAIGEEFASKWQALPFIERGLTQYMRLDICNIGGFTEAMKVAGWCEAHYIDLMPHNPLGPICAAASVHMAAAISNFAWLEHRSSPVEELGFNDKTIFTRQCELDGANLKVPDRPGLGIEIDETALRAATPQPHEPPHLRRKDGSHTNW